MAAMENFELASRNVPNKSYEVWCKPRPLIESLRYYSINQFNPRIEMEEASAIIACQKNAVSMSNGRKIDAIRPNMLNRLVPQTPVRTKKGDLVTLCTASCPKLRNVAQPTRLLRL